MIDRFLSYQWQSYMPACSTQDNPEYSSDIFMKTIFFSKKVS